MLANIISLVSGCVTFLGGFLVVWGAVSLGLAIREQQGGSQIASAISTIAGGAIIIAAAVYFGMRAEKFAPLLFSHHMKDQRLLYESLAPKHLTLIERGAPSRRAKRMSRRKGAEANEPTREYKEAKERDERGQEEAQE